MKPTEKFLQTVENGFKTGTDFKINKQLQKPEDKQTENRTIILSQIQALIDWALGKSDLLRT